MTEMDNLLSSLLADEQRSTEAAERIFSVLRDRGWLSRVTVQRYMCRRGCQLATVVRVEGNTLCEIRDYKYSPGLNESQSVPAARERNTIDGDRWWPSHVYSVDRLAAWGGMAGMSIVCRHYRGVLQAADVLTSTRDVTPGRPKKPSILGVS